MTRVFVTGPTGTVGSAVVTKLLARGATVVAGVLEPVAPTDAWAAVEQRPFAFGAPLGSAKTALEGADGLFLMRPPPISDVQTFLFRHRRRREGRRAEHRVPVPAGRAAQPRHTPPRRRAVPAPAAGTVHHAPPQLLHAESVQHLRRTDPTRRGCSCRPGGPSPRSSTPATSVPSPPPCSPSPAMPAAPTPCRASRP